MQGLPNGDGHKMNGQTSRLRSPESPNAPYNPRCLLRTPVHSPGPTRKSPSRNMLGKKSPLKESPQCSVIDEGTASTFDGARSHQCASSVTPSRQRSFSLSLSMKQGPAYTPPQSPEDSNGFHFDDDMDSLYSYNSMTSATSCEHVAFARNGTTFSGRQNKFVVHCPSHLNHNAEYLTPTQRAQRQIRRLKTLLQQAKLDLEEKDSEIFKLTKEVVELRLYKESLRSPEEPSTSSDATTVKEILSPGEIPSTDIIPLALQTSCTDSGHFDDLSASPVHTTKTCQQSTSTDDAIYYTEEDRRKLIEFYERKLDDMTREHGLETQALKKEHNERVETLLNNLAQVNERYCQLVPDYETAKERIRELEKELDDVSQQLDASEKKHQKLYLQIYRKMDASGSQSNAAMGICSTSTVSRLSVSELLSQLQCTQHELDNIRDVCDGADQQLCSNQSLLSAKEAISLWVLGARKAMYRRLAEAKENKTQLDPDVTLQFLKSAIYYFLTDKDNHRGHLKAIQAILGFNNDEITNIDRANAFN